MPLAAAIGVEVGTDLRLRERMNWEGEQDQALEDFLAESQVATNDRSYVPRSGDSSEQAAARFIEAITELTVVGDTRRKGRPKPTLTVGWVQSRHAGAVPGVWMDRAAVLTPPGGAVGAGGPAARRRGGLEGPGGCAGAPG